MMKSKKKISLGCVHKTLATHFLFLRAVDKGERDKCYKISESQGSENIPSTHADKFKKPIALHFAFSEKNIHSMIQAQE